MKASPATMTWLLVYSMSSLVLSTNTFTLGKDRQLFHVLECTDNGMFTCHISCIVDPLHSLAKLHACNPLSTAFN